MGANVSTSSIAKSSSKEADKIFAALDKDKNGKLNLPALGGPTPGLGRSAAGCLYAPLSAAAR